MKNFYRPWNPDNPKGGGVYWAEYTDDDIRAAWETRGQGHADAVARGKFCVVVECDPEGAVLLSRLFIRDVFAIPTCCHYDGKTLSMYCGDSGSNYLNTMNHARAIQLRASIQIGATS